MISRYILRQLIIDSFEQHIFNANKTKKIAKRFPIAIAFFGHIFMNCL